MIQNTKHASLSRRLGSPIQTDVLRIQSDQEVSESNQPSCSPSEFCPKLRQRGPTAPNKQASCSARPGSAIPAKVRRGQSKRKTPNPTKPTKQLRAAPEGTTPCWKTRVTLFACEQATHDPGGQRTPRNVIPDPPKSDIHPFCFLQGIRTVKILILTTNIQNQKGHHGAARKSQHHCPDQARVSI